MPFHVTESSRCPAGKSWAVINSTTGRVMGCHESREKAIQQMKALYVHVPEARK
jgi:hypothetical protein